MSDLRDEFYDSVNFSNLLDDKADPQTLQDSQIIQDQDRFPEADKIS